MSHFGKDNVDYLTKEVLCTIVSTMIIHYIGSEITLPFLILIWMLAGNNYISTIVHNRKFPPKNHLNQLLYSWVFMSAYIGFFTDMGEIMIWSIPLWIVGNVVGLHFGFLDNLPVFRNFDITPSEMKKWKWPQWTIFYSIIALFSCVGMYSVPFFNRTLLIGYIIVISIIVLISWIIYPKYVFHIHHFFVALFFMPITCLGNDGLLILVQGILMGVYIQAVTVWGLAWIWQKNN